MTTRTRYFVIVSLLVLCVGVGTGLVAYYVGFPGALAAQPGIEDLRFLPQNTRLVAYADVRGVMNSELRRKLLTLLPVMGTGQREIAEETGINIESDIDQVLAGLASPQSGQQLPASLLIIARGRFDTARIEGLMRQQGAQVEEYRGARLIVGAHHPTAAPGDSLAVAFIEPGVAALGNAGLIRAAVDQKAGGRGATQNAELMKRVSAFAAGDAWAVGQFDELVAQAQLGPGLLNQLPPIAWFAANASVDSGLHTKLHAEARDQAAADNLRDVIRGFIALGRLQLTAQPALKGLLDSLALQGTGTTVSVSFDLPGEVVDVLGAAAGIRPELPGK